MISAWFKHLKTDKEKEQFKNTLLGSKTVLNRLQELLNEEEDNLDRLELNTKIYDIPNWKYRQADMNGCRRTLKSIRTLINLDHKDT